MTPEHAQKTDNLVANFQKEKSERDAKAEGSSRPNYPSLKIGPVHIRTGDKSTPARPWLVKNFAMRRRLTFIIGTGGSNKTTWGFQALFNFALNLTFAGYKPMRALKTLVVSGEEDTDEMKRKLEALAHHHLGKKFTPKNVAELMSQLHPVFHTYEPDETALRDAIPCQPILEMVRGTIRRTEFFDRVKADVIEGKYDVIYFDPLISLHAGFTEGETIPLMQALVLALREIAIAGNCAVITAHHTSQGGATDINNQHASRGSTALPDGGRVQINMMGMTEETGKDLFPGDPDAYLDYVELANTKATYSRKTTRQIFKRVPYELETPLENGDKDFGIVLVEQTHLQQKLREPSISERPWFTEFLDAVDAAFQSGEPYTAARKGKGKRADTLLVEGFGVASVKYAQAALDGLVGQHILVSELHHDKKGKRDVKVYRVNFRPAPPGSIENAEQHI
ncbi:hypothetical protein GGD65_008077 [Bradyrhizobium sp. CIR18]|uniref:AAA family ATPase n=1 Tax=Bradyrhizobium sp. CIR18 TaxID=2663839 RepID=UPI0016064181|nr:AAA family ATPase [Bradyrhizobium sp. CIR18]MBB4367003.1 hypothetical protein [Bradyrhizobium sp. CIR18]